MRFFFALIFFIGPISSLLSYIFRMLGSKAYVEIEDYLLVLPSGYFDRRKIHLRYKKETVTLPTNAIKKTDIYVYKKTSFTQEQIIEYCGFLVDEKAFNLSEKPGEIILTKKFTNFDIELKFINFDIEFEFLISTIIKNK